MSGTRDKQRMIDSAVAFFLAGERLEPTFEFGVYPAHRVDAPVVVNYALALEIATKLLIQITRGDEVNGHDYTSLFFHVPHSSRIHLEYIVDCLNEIHSCFVDWRYAYEHDFLAVSPTNIRRSFILVHKEIRRVEPNLRSIYEKDWCSFEPNWNWAWFDAQIRELDREQKGSEESE